MATIDDLVRNVVFGFFEPSYETAKRIRFLQGRHVFHGNDIGFGLFDERCKFFEQNPFLFVVTPRALRVCRERLTWCASHHDANVTIAPRGFCVFRRVFSDVFRDERYPGIAFERVATCFVDIDAFDDFQARFLQAIGQTSSAAEQVNDLRLTHPNPSRNCCCNTAIISIIWLSSQQYLLDLRSYLQRFA